MDDTPIDGSNEIFSGSLLDGRRAPSPGLWDEMRSFLAIARAGSLLGATEALGISQPTLSRHHCRYCSPCQYGPAQPVPAQTSEGQQCPRIEQGRRLPAHSHAST
ncbi:MAG: LysR family transcriptional regulator [Alphaproteobacteria bacterium TMED89]|nr:hypothetical protein [Rhodospirillaceae bacterium]RPH12414.1 MAG: LysR family transcriptional regulator [Alphaproteobacteria bacterium TMED89]